MTKLDCNVVNCAYNEDSCCKRSNISVEGEDAHVSPETCCGSFALKGCNCASNAADCVCKETEVACDAIECMYNRSKQCQANHIGICGRSASCCDQTECGSFTMA